MSPWGAWKSWTIRSSTLHALAVEHVDQVIGVRIPPRLGRDVPLVLDESQPQRERRGVTSENETLVFASPSPSPDLTKTAGQRDDRDDGSEAGRTFAQQNGRLIRFAQVRILAGALLWPGRRRLRRSIFSETRPTSEGQMHPGPSRQGPYEDSSAGSPRHTQPDHRDDVSLDLVGPTPEGEDDLATCLPLEAAT